MYQTINNLVLQASNMLPASLAHHNSFIIQVKHNGHSTSLEYHKQLESCGSEIPLLERAEDLHIVSKNSTILLTLNSVPIKSLPSLFDVYGYVCYEYPVSHRDKIPSSV